MCGPLQDLWGCWPLPGQFFPSSNMTGSYTVGEGLRCLFRETALAKLLSSRDLACLSANGNFVMSTVKNSPWDVVNPQGILIERTKAECPSVRGTSIHWNGRCIFRSPSFAPSCTWHGLSFIGKACHSDEGTKTGFPPVGISWLYYFP